MRAQQYDLKHRVVSAVSLQAMCSHVSGTYCHTFKVEKVSRSRVHVSYSNENEYAFARPIVAIFPCYPNEAYDKDNPLVILDCIRILYAADEYDPIQYFWQLLDCPVMYPPSDLYGPNWVDHDRLVRAVALRDLFSTLASLA